MDVFVARQPIFDRESHVQAYELLYRANATSSEFTGSDEDSPTLDVIAGSLLTIGLNSIAAGKKAFINFGRNLLVDGLVSMLPKENVVIEILETVQPDAEIVDICRQLRSQGYTIALDDFVQHPHFEQLAAIAHIIKVDLRITSRTEQVRLVRTYQPRGILMLAEKVETREEFEWASGLGFDYFQGYFFARPAIISARGIQPVVVTCLQLLCQLQSPELDFKKLEELIRKDVALTYKLFRFVNSALVARHGNVQTIRSALMHLGEDGIRQWATIATLARAGKNKPQELVAYAIVRARFCENLARIAGDTRYLSAYLIGLFSLLDALLDRPLEETLIEVGLAPEINNVLLNTADVTETLARVYKLVRSYEVGEWEQVRQSASVLGLVDSDVSTAYVEATEWTNQILRGMHASDSGAPAHGSPRKEKRRRKRDPIDGTTTVLWGSHPDEELLVQASLIDVSAFGARFRLLTQVPRGSWLMFNHHKLGISGRGTVRYCRMVKSMYEIGVEFAGGTGWGATPHSLRAHLRNLSVAIDRLQAGDAIDETIVTEPSLITRNC